MRTVLPSQGEHQMTAQDFILAFGSVLNECIFLLVFVTCAEAMPPPGGALAPQKGSSQGAGLRMTASAPSLVNLG